MTHLDDLPKRDENHRIAELSESAFRSAVTECGAFVIQSEDRRDYGTDFQIEVCDGGAMTNIRVQVQLKGTNCKENSDGSVSRQVSRATLNYLLMQPGSIFVCYHIQSERLLVRETDSVLREYEHNGKQWITQKTITVNFIDNFDAVYQNAKKAHAIASAKAARTHRLSYTIQPPEKIPTLLQEGPDVHVPTDPEQAKELLITLYNRGKDRSISQSFEKFHAVLGTSTEYLIHTYMAEINLGINGLQCDKSRIEEGIKVLQSVVAKGNHESGSLLYSIGNGWLAINDYEKAKEAYNSALTFFEQGGDSAVIAQCAQNLGSTMEKLGKSDEAYTLYEKALELDHYLSEAHYALAVWHCRRDSELDRALDHLDAIVWDEGSAGNVADVQGWRIYILFNTGDIRSAFREINALLGEENKLDGVWLYCARLVAIHGRMSLDAAQKALQFWDRYLNKFSKDLMAKTERLLCIWYIKSNGGSVEHDFESFKQAIANVVSQGALDPAFLWDRVGHWAQDENNWVEAEKCYRKAFELSPAEYGYCLGTALNFLRRYDEALPILTDQAEKHIPDAMSWFQVAVARGGMNDIEGCISAYKRALQLDENYALAWFNLGGIYWNSQNEELAIAIWQEAIQRFPSHELSLKLLQDFSSLLKLS